MPPGSFMKAVRLPLPHRYAFRCAFSLGLDIAVGRAPRKALPPPATLLTFTSKPRRCSPPPSLHQSLTCTGGRRRQWRPAPAHPIRALRATGMAPGACAPPFRATAARGVHVPCGGVGYCRFAPLRTPALPHTGVTCRTGRIGGTLLHAFWCRWTGRHGRPERALT